MKRYHAEKWYDRFLCYQYKLKSVACFQKDTRKDIVAMKKLRKADQRRARKKALREMNNKLESLKWARQSQMGALMLNDHL